MKLFLQRIRFYLIAYMLLVVRLIIKQNSIPILNTLLTNHLTIINQLELQRQVVHFLNSNAKAGPGIVFATGNPDFDMTFVKAIAQQRFWDREIY